MGSIFSLFLSFVFVCICFVYAAVKAHACSLGLEHSVVRPMCPLHL